MSTWAVTATALAGAVGTGGVSVWSWLRQRALSRRLATAEYEASHDPLTGLWNRRGFTDAANQLIAQTAGPLLLAVGDVDGFKLVNDLHGHHTGDRVLQMVAKRLAAAVPAGGLVARLGGDEFALLLVPGGVGPSRLLRQLRRAVAEPVPLAGGQVSVDISLGGLVVDAATLAGVQGLSAGLRIADALSYEAKASETGWPVVRWLLDAAAGLEEPVERPVTRCRDVRAASAARGSHAALTVGGVR